jgi:spermidine synthase
MWSRLHAAPAAAVVQREDGSGLSLLKDLGSDQTVVYANGIGQSMLPYGGLHTVLGALPAMIHRGPAAVAVIGLGSGDTTFGIGGRAETRTIDSIEIIAPELDTLAHVDQRQTFAGLRMLLRDDRIRHWFTDGRTFIRKGQRRYDIIEADALRPTSAYAGNLYSVEYFELLRNHLNPDGLAVTWAPTLRVVNSIITAFPHVLLFDNVAIGSASPVVFDRTAIRDRMASTFTRDYYARGDIDLDLLLAPFLAADPRVISPAFDRRELTDVNRDLFPKDEFAIPQSEDLAAPNSETSQ